MRDVAPGLLAWLDSEVPFALAVLVGVRGSAPRSVGTVMAVAGTGEVLGSLSGGCIEGAVHGEALDVLDGAPARVVTYGITDDDALAVGLTCGGAVDVLVCAAEPAPVRRVAEEVLALRPISFVVVIGPEGALGAQLAVTPEGVVGTTGERDLDDVLAEQARSELAQARTSHLRVGGLDALTSTQLPPPRMLIFGGTDFAAALAAGAALVGFHVTVCDARPVFATPQRFPAAHDVVCMWPDQYLSSTQVTAMTAICVLTHDPKFDLPLLETALRSPAGYVGAMGSRRTHRQRVTWLRESGMTASELARLHSPIGLDLQAVTPEETAVSILAEIIATRRGGSGAALRKTDGPLRAVSP